MNTILKLALAGMLVATTANAETGRLRPGRGPLIAPSAPGLINVSGDIELGTRELVAGGAVARVDLSRFLLNGGIDLMPWLTTYAGVGWMLAELEDQKGEGGFTWQAGVSVNLLEQILSASPVGGVKQSMGLTLDTAYRYSSSNRGRDDFNWHELTVTPLFNYTVTRANDPLRHTAQPAATALLLGVQFSNINGDLGDESLRENRNFAGVAGAQFLLDSQWSSTLQAVLYGGGDRLIRVRLGRYF